jgi:hypothetical protein
LTYSKRTIPDGAAPSGTRGRKVWDSGNALVRSVVVSNGVSNRNKVGLRQGDMHCGPRN